MSAANDPSSLVRRSKSSTADNYEYEDWEIDVINHWANEAAAEENHQQRITPIPDQNAPTLTPAYSELQVDEAPSGKYLAVSCETWHGIEKTEEGHLYTPLNHERGIWKAVMHTDTRAKSTPPPQCGDRWTEKLSSRGKQKIEQSSKYLYRIGRGYRTFATLTFTPEWRAQIEKWDQMPRGEQEKRSTIGRLVTDLLNTLQQRHRNGLSFDTHYRRAGKQKKGGAYQANGSHFKGKVSAWNPSARWTPIKRREAFKIPAANSPFQFAWVIENPINEKGERNPHIHILLNWGVKQDQFHAWAGWIEKCWGKGFAKLERIKKPSAAAHYMAKAANYISKGSDGQQGPVRGNRYSVARDGRPPKARTIGLFDAEGFKEIIDLGNSAGKDNLPKGIWFHDYGFGASSRTAWGKIWTALKADGVQLKPPPMSLYAAHFRNTGAQLLRKKYDYWTQYLDAFCADAISGAITP